MEGKVSAPIDPAVKIERNRMIAPVGLAFEVVFQIQIAVLRQTLGHHDVMGFITRKVRAPPDHHDGDEGKQDKCQQPDEHGMGLLQ